MATFIFSVKLPVGSDGLSPTALWAAEGSDETTATTALLARLAQGLKIIESAGIANARLTELLQLERGSACELSSGVARTPQR